MKKLKLKITAHANLLIQLWGPDLGLSRLVSSFDHVGGHRSYEVDQKRSWQIFLIQIVRAALGSESFLTTIAAEFKSRERRYDSLKKSQRTNPTANVDGCGEFHFLRKCITNTGLFNEEFR